MDNLEGRDVEVGNTGNHESQVSRVHVHGQVQNSRNDANGEKMLSPWVPYPQTSSILIFLISFLIGVSTDPLFLYVPIINEDKKCLTMDGKLKIAAIVLRSVTDFTYLLYIISRFQSACKTAKAFKLSLRTRFPWPYILIDVLCIIPLPQVIVLVYFSKIAGSRSVTTRKILNLLLLLQYVPRILRVYLSAKDLSRDLNSMTRRGQAWVVKGVFNFFLYVIAGHVFGAFWYFHSIYRETACWHHACEHYPGCVPSPFDCHGNIPLSNLTFINEFCPVNPPNANVFDFGIFADAVESRILASTKFLNKFSHCFWWGLRNLSSFGSNLETSSNTEENFFAVLISILGLLLFLILIGNFQTYMQMATEKAEERRQKISEKDPEITSYLSNHDHQRAKRRLITRHLEHAVTEGKEVDVKYLFSLLEEHIENSERPHHEHNERFAEWVTKIMDKGKHEKDSKEQQAELWVENQKIPKDMRQKIKQYVRLRMRDGKDVDVQNLLFIIPSSLGTSVKRHLCFPILKKVPMLENMDEKVYNTICSYLKPVVYQENSFITRKGEPLDLMLFITQGFLWSFEFESSTSPVERLQGGDYFGVELFEWQLKSYTNCPIATCNVKSHTKVEAFTLSAIDLERVIKKCWYKFPAPTDDAKKARAIMFLREFRRCNNATEGGKISEAASSHGHSSQASNL